MSDTANRDQQEFWGDEAGPKWVVHQAAMDAQLAPVLDGVLRRAALQPGEHVLDIGCGAGMSTFRAADDVGPQGAVTGLDISHSLFAVADAAARAHANVQFILDDAATHRFAPAKHDALISRFGVMFFDDPVAAFRNIAHALRPGGRMIFACWGQIDANPYFKTAARAANEILGPTPKSDPDLPGPFAFRDPARVHAILTAAGFEQIEVEVTDLALTPSGSLRDFIETACVIGPAERALVHHKASDTDRARLVARLEEVFAVHMTDAGLRIPAEINFVSAIRPAR